jgi:hypothetical protein
MLGLFRRRCLALYTMSVGWSVGRCYRSLTVYEYHYMIAISVSRSKKDNSRRQSKMTSYKHMIVLRSHSLVASFSFLDAATRISTRGCVRPSIRAMFEKIVEICGLKWSEYRESPGKGEQLPIPPLPNGSRICWSCIQPCWDASSRLHIRGYVRAYWPVRRFIRP